MGNEWDQITAMTIKNCFRKIGYIDGNLLEQIMPSEESDSEDDLPLCVLAEMYKKKDSIGISE